MIFRSKKFDTIFKYPNAVTPKCTEEMVYEMWDGKYPKGFAKYISFAVIDQNPDTNCLPDQNKSQ